MTPMCNQLSFKEFLLEYVQELSVTGESELLRLAEEASFLNVRMRAPLVLLAAKLNEGVRFFEHLRSIRDQSGMIEMLHRLPHSDLELWLTGGNAPLEYKKVWTSYVCRRDAPQRDAELLDAVRKKILLIQADRGLGISDICDAPSTDKNAVRRWLEDADASEIRFETAKQIVDYLIN